MPNRSFPLTPAPIRVRDEVLDDLRRRLTATKWPLDAGNDDGYYGVRRSYLAELVAYWADGFDWRAAEAAINAYEHYRVDVGGVPVHFMRKPGVGPDPVPLILSHGWPWTFWHWSKVIDPLADPAAYGDDPADAFDVIVPSLPGFGFSTPLTHQPDMNFSKIADVWHELMTGVLAYEKYAAGGCDVGALVTGQLGHKYADELYAIHIGSALKLTFFNGDRAWDFSGGRPIPENLPPTSTSGSWLWKSASPSTWPRTSWTQPRSVTGWPTPRPACWPGSWSAGRTGQTTAGDVESVFSRDDLLTHATIYWAGQRHRHIDPHLRQQQPLPLDTVAQPVAGDRGTQRASPSSATRTRPA